MTKTKILAGILLVCAILSALCACRGKVDAQGSVTVVLAPAAGEVAVYTVTLKDGMTGDGLFAVLNALRDENGVNYAENGGFLTEVGAVRQNADAGAYIGVYTSVEADADTSGWLSPVSYGGKTLAPAKCGAADMTVTDGAVFYIGIIEW